jgi:hypothetical protein
LSKLELIIVFIHHRDAAASAMLEEFGVVHGAMMVDHTPSGRTFRFGLVVDNDRCDSLGIPDEGRLWCSEPFSPGDSN